MSEQENPVPCGCGGLPVLFDHKWLRGPRFSVECKGCNIETWGRNTAQEAIAEWNRAMSRQPTIEENVVEREISFTCEQTGRRYTFPNTAKLIEAFLIANTRHGDSSIAPTVDEELVERAARAIYAVSPAYFSGTTVEVPWEEAAPPYKAGAIREARAAIAAMQPAIDKAVADEQARCVSVCLKYEGSENQKIAGTARAIRQSIEQGGGVFERKTND